MTVEAERGTGSLRSAIEHLALPGDEGLARRGCSRPDQLAIEFDEAYTAFVTRLAEMPPPGCFEALQVLDQRLEAMSDPDLHFKWTAESMKSDPDWDTVRNLAGAVLSAFGWK